MTVTDPNQGVLFYTQDEVDSKLAEANKEMYRQVEVARTSTKTLIADAIAATLKDELREGTMDKDNVNELYARIAERADLPARTINNTYSVTVSYNGESIAEFSGIEADNEDSAVEEVENNMDVEVEINFTLSYNNDTEYGSVSQSSYDFDLDYEANEE